MKTIKLLITLVLLTSSYHLAAQVSLGQTKHGGSGCPDGTVSNTLSSDGVLSVKFKEFKYSSNASPPGEIGKTCRLLIPINIEKGYQTKISISTIYGTMNVSSPGREQNTVLLSFSYRHDVGKNYDTTTHYDKFFKSPGDEIFSIKDIDNLYSYWSPCGLQTKLDTAISFVSPGVPTSVTGGNKILSIGSPTDNTGLEFKIESRRCF